ncbi:MAG: hypothetical protein IMY72_11770 [Bacteroidetes bacterium]|nr:hypothetical protein [Bacteroidota bacterium]
MFVFAVFTANTAKSQSYDVRFDKADTYRTAWTTDADTINGVSTVSKVFKVAKPYKYSVQMQMSAVKVYADSTCVFTLYGSMDAVNYTSIASQIWSITGDTTIMLSGSSLGWRFLKGSLTGNGSATRAIFGKTHVNISQ